MAQIDQLLKWVRDHDGSDLHLVSGLEPRVRIHGGVSPIADWPKMTTQLMEAVFKEITPPMRWKQFVETKDTDFAYGLDGVGRFRVNLAVNDRGLAGVMRLIPDEIKTLEDLGLPPVLKNFTKLDKGLVLVSGATGSGKSTTLAAIINELNAKRQCHMITIEDPLEFVHENKQAVISHREVGTHGKSFSSILRIALHSDADVILVGELRDAETISLALEAAETGVLVFSTLHANTAASALDRLIGVFPGEQQILVRSVLAETLAGVVAQVLVPTIAGGRTAAQEILFRSQSVPNIIRAGNMGQIYSITGQDAVRTLDAHLASLVKSEICAPEDARPWSLDRVAFDRMAGLAGATSRK